MKIREEAILYGCSRQLSRHDVLGLILEKHQWKIVALGKKTATMLFLPVKQIRTQTLVHGFGPHPHTTLLTSACRNNQPIMLSDNDDGVLDVERIQRLGIYLNYTRPISKTATTNYPLRRVFKVGGNLDRLAFQALNTRSNPERKPTFNFYNHASDFKGNETEVESGTRGEEKYEKHTETQKTAIMSSEKAINPKDKLEGTYLTRIWGLPPFYASIYQIIKLMLS
jgi:hypothetical protein